MECFCEFPSTYTRRFIKKRYFRSVPGLRFLGARARDEGAAAEVVLVWCLCWLGY